MKCICPVCGYEGLEEEPYDCDGNPSYGICDCCGFEFGFDDLSNGKTFEKYRREWIEGGAKWFVAEKRPSGWNVKEQLSNIDDL